MPDLKKTGAAVLAGVLILFAGLVSPVAAQTQLRFGVLPVVDTLPLIVGQQQGLFAAQQIDLELVAFQSALERDAALQAGRLDGYFGDILNTVLLINTGHELRILTTAYHTHPDHRMFGIVTAPEAGIVTVAQLKNRPVAISRATIIEYLLDRLLQQQGRTPAFVTKQEIKKIPIRLQMLLAGKVPAALLPEPLLTLAESKGARVLVDDRRLNMSETVLAMQTQLLSQDATLADRFLRAYALAVNKINHAPQAYKPVLVEKTRFPKPIAGRYKMPRFPAVAPPSPADVAAAQAWLKNRGMISRPVAYENIVVMNAPAATGKQ